MELTERMRPECLYVRATIFVEHDSQKGISDRQGGTMLSGSAAARRELEAFFGIKVFLELKVDVRRRWRSDDRRCASSASGSPPDGLTR